MLPACVFVFLCVSSAFANLASQELVESESQRLAAGLLEQAKKGDSMCWKKTWDRGVGLIPTYCTDSSHPSNEGGLCYKNCNSGEYGAVTMCMRTCPSGYHDYGATCTYSSAGYGKGCCCTIFGCCNKDCGPNFYDDGGCMCQPKTINKLAWDRGVGIIPTGCSSDRHNEAGLCYLSCGNGFTSFATSCWQNCHGDFGFDCGMACTTTQGTCISGVFDMVTGPLMLVVDIASGGAVGEAVSAIRMGAKALVKAAATKLAQSFSKDAVAGTIKNMAKKVGKQIQDGAVDKVMAMAQTTGLSGEPPEADLTMLTMLDPTGIADIVLSYTHPICAPPASAAASFVQRATKMQLIGQTATGALTPS